MDQETFVFQIMILVPKATKMMEDKLFHVLLTINFVLKVLKTMDLVTYVFCQIKSVLKDTKMTAVKH